MNRRTRTAFSLLELLVVIGIIAVLIGILLPVLFRVREHEKWVRCQANLRTIGQMLVIYSNGNKGWVFPVKTDAFGIVGLGINVPPHERWPMKVFDMPGAPNPPPYDPAAYTVAARFEPRFDPAPYTPPVLRCPADPDAFMGHSYVLNNHLADESIRMGKHVKGISSTDIIVAGEKFTQETDYYVDYGDYDRVVEPFRHGRVGSNYLYFDWHVTSALPKHAKRGIDPWDVRG
jgi:prepilin-type N-terminal cleavage/methylation domain-containing protein/prepilin-type processing-associated H-X9-DG protein